ncbi:MAG: transketolase [Acidobacteria bacterium]|nr:transketolase [Acidobacteriota bacterium]
MATDESVPCPPPEEVTLDIEQRSVDALRILAVDAVQRAESGHAGMPMGMADLAAVLWSEVILLDPDDPSWPDRDRFVLSNGHGSMLLYSLLHLSGFGLEMEELENFRQFGSRTAGHPEYEPNIGIEMTTGPLGQGFAAAVGMAIAEAHLNAELGPELVDHRTYAFVSDGDLMEGVASEAASLAGHLNLSKLTYIYDDNQITIDGPTDLTFSEDVAARFGAYGWHTVDVDGHDRPAIREAIASANESNRPSLVIARTHIGYGSPSKQDTAAAHSNPLGVDEVKLVREAYGWDLPPFVIPEDVYGWFESGMERGRSAHRAWEARRVAAFAADAELEKRWAAFYEPANLIIDVPVFEGSVATRSVSGAVIQDIAAALPGLVGGSGDLTPSNNTLIEGSQNFSAEHPEGRNLRFGVREHAMGAVVNGINLHGGLRAYGGTFLIFSDYMRGAVRLSALMGAPSIWIWTHDSVFLGEDGPTHQPIEHLASLRAMPNLWVMRPADATEVTVAWETAINRTDGPTAIVLTRQSLPSPTTPPERADVRRGAYIRHDGTDLVIVATGSEVPLAERAAEVLQANGISARIVSMPSWEAFAAQDDAYRAVVLPPSLPVVTLEAGTTFGWGAVSGLGGLRIGIDHFGASAPYAVIAAEWGFTPEAVAQRIEDWLSQSSALSPQSSDTFDR